MYLVDTNIWLERLLGQKKSEIVGKFLSDIPSEYLSISDFAFHSIAVILCRLNQKEVFLQFVEDLMINGSVTVLNLEAEDMVEVAAVMGEFNLDFDDAYQYIVARKHSLEIVSFDKDFDATANGRTSPEDVNVNWASVPGPGIGTVI